MPVGSNRRYGDSIARAKDNARAEAAALVPASLPEGLVTSEGGPIVQGSKNPPVTAWVEIGGTLIRIHGHAIAWNTRCVQVRWSGTNPEASTAWVWASAVTRDAGS